MIKNICIPKNGFCYWALVCCVFCTATVIAQTSNPAVACLNEDVRVAFFGASVRISPGVLDELPRSLQEVQAPLELRFLGSANSAQMARIGFITQLDIPSAESKVVAALAEQGFFIPQVRNQRLQQKGFQVQGIRHGQVSMCHPDLGGMLVRTRKNDLGTIVTASHYYKNNFSCGDKKLHEIYDGKFSTDFLPRLNLPDGAYGEHNGGSGGVRHAYWRTIFDSSKGPTILRSHFHKQLEQQGWNLDGQWQNAQASGSIWSSIAQSEQLKIVGMLAVRALDGSKHEVVFSASIYN